MLAWYAIIGSVLFRKFICADKSLKALDVVGLSRLTCLCDIEVWSIASELHTQLIVSFFRGSDGVFQLQGNKIR